jgi:hypothetical protein
MAAINSNIHSSSFDPASVPAAASFEAGAAVSVPGTGGLVSTPPSITVAGSVGSGGISAGLIYTNGQPTYAPPQPAYWTDAGIGSGGTCGCDPGAPPMMPGESWGSYLGRLTPGEVDHLMQTNQIPASVLENDQQVALTVQQDVQKFSAFLTMISGLMSASHSTAEAIAQNIRG